MKAHWQVGLSALAALIASQAAAGQYVYPAKGQDQAQQAKDEAECSTWATQKTGFDPSKAPSNTGSGLASGGLGSSAATAALGAIPGASNLAPAAGMLSGGGQAASAGAMGVAASAFPAVAGQGSGASQVMGVVNQAMSKPQQGQPAKPGQADYDQARAACLDGRGYSVK